MPRSPAAPSGLPARLSAFVLERYPFALPLARQALGRVPALAGDPDSADIERCRDLLKQQLTQACDDGAADELPDPTPHVSAAQRHARARAELVEACDGFLAREAIAASLTAAERREILRGMVLTRAVDNRLKQFFASGEVTFRGRPFQGKGFRSLGQEAIYAAGIRLRRGAAWQDAAGGWHGDVVGPIIRDLGVALAMRPEPATVRMVLNAQMGKDEAPMHGKDLHVGDFAWGVLPAAAPLSRPILGSFSTFTAPTTTRGSGPSRSSSGRSGSTTRTSTPSS